METAGMVKPDDSLRSSEYEAVSLRQELILRILLQNLLLLVTVGLFGLLAGVAAVAPVSAWPLAASFNVAALAAVLQWCHHGVRTAQIKNYLLRIDANESGWERWLPANRPPGLLGSRWMLSTKGVFLGLGLASMALAALVAPSFAPLPPAVAAGLWVASALFLFTNPKE